MDTEDEDSIKARELSDSTDSSDDEVFGAINCLRPPPPPQDKRASTNHQATKNKRSKVSMVSQFRRS